MSAVAFKPLKHGERFVYVSGRAVYRYHSRVDRPVKAEVALEKAYVYTEKICVPETEGVTWARGWNTKAAKALRVACAL